MGNYRHCSGDWDLMCAAEHFACEVHATADLREGNYLEWTVYCPNKPEGIRLLVMLFTCHRRSFAQIIIIHLLFPLDLHPTQYARRNISLSVSSACWLSADEFYRQWRCLGCEFSAGSFCSRCERKFFPVYAMRRIRRAEVWLHSFVTSATDGAECSTSQSGIFNPGKIRRDSLSRRLDGPLSWTGSLEEDFFLCWDLNPGLSCSYTRDFTRQRYALCMNYQF